MTLHEKVTDALRFWEPARLVYNLILAATVLFMMRDSLFQLNPEAFLGFAVLALLANVVYSAAYVPDLFVQSSDFAPLWRRIGRPLLWIIGMLFAFTIAVVILMSEQPMVPKG